MQWTNENNREEWNQEGLYKLYVRAVDLRHSDCRNSSFGMKQDPPVSTMETVQWNVSVCSEDHEITATVGTTVNLPSRSCA